MVDRSLGNQGDSVEIDPLPEGDIFNHLMSLHFTLHLYIEYLQALSSWKTKGERGGEREGEGKGDSQSDKEG